MAPAAARAPLVLGLDLGRVSAAAWREGAGIATEVRVLARDHEAARASVASWVADLVLLVDPDVVVIERDDVRGRGHSARAALRAAAIHGCRLRGVVRVEMTPARARGLALGDRNLTQAQAVVQALATLPISADCTQDEIDAAILVAAQEALMAAPDRRVAA